jgi:hypothetical protein
MSDLGDLVIYGVGFLHGALALQGIRMLNDWRHERALRRWLDDL